MNVVKKIFLLSTFFLSAQNTFGMSLLRTKISACTQRSCTSIFKISIPKSSMFFSQKNKNIDCAAALKKSVGGRTAFQTQNCSHEIAEFIAAEKNKNYWEKFRDFVKSRYKKYATRLFGGTMAGVALTQQDDELAENKKKQLAELLILMKKFGAAVGAKNFKEAGDLLPYMPKGFLNELLFSVINDEKSDLNKMLFLLANGADVVYLPSGITALHAAAFHGNITAVHMMCGKYGMSENTRDAKNGDTLAHYAAKNGQIKMVEELIKMGADLTLKNNKGKTAQDYLDEFEDE